MLKGKNLTNGFWEEDVNTVVYLKNRNPEKSLDFKTPFEALLGFKPAVNHLIFFDSKDFSHVQKRIGRNWIQIPLNEFLFGIAQSLKLIHCLIPLLINCLQVEM